MRDEGKEACRMICRRSEQIISKSFELHLQIDFGVTGVAVLCSCVLLLFDLGEGLDLEFPGYLLSGWQGEGT